MSSTRKAVAICTCGAGLASRSGRKRFARSVAVFRAHASSRRRRMETCTTVVAHASKVEGLSCCALERTAKGGTAERHRQLDISGEVQGRERSMATVEVGEPSDPDHQTRRGRPTETRHGDTVGDQFLPFGSFFPSQQKLQQQ